MRRIIYPLAFVVIVAVVGGSLWGFNFSRASNSLPPVNIEVIAREMSFNENNPPIVIKKGQTIHLTVKNEEESGVYHDFEISALRVKTQLLEPGEAETLNFTANREGIFTYTCPFHPRMMVGKVIVE